MIRLLKYGHAKSYHFLFFLQLQQHKKQQYFFFTYRIMKYSNQNTNLNKILHKYFYLPICVILISLIQEPRTSKINLIHIYKVIPHGISINSREVAPHSKGLIINKLIEIS